MPLDSLLRAYVDSVKRVVEELEKEEQVTEVLATA